VPDHPVTSLNPHSCFQLCHSLLGEVEGIMTPAFWTDIFRWPSVAFDRRDFYMESTRRFPKNELGIFR
jgi:hypothetical protein